MTRRKTGWIPVIALAAAVSPLLTSAGVARPYWIDQRICAEAVNAACSLEAWEVQLSVLVIPEFGYENSFRVQPQIEVHNKSGDHFNINLSLTIFLLQGTTVWPVPGDWNNAANSVETIGAGGSGGLYDATAGYGCGGGGGGYSKSTNLTLTPGANIQVQIGLGGPSSTANTNGGNALGVAGTDTFFNGTSLATSTVGAQGGQGGGNSQTGGTVAASGGAGGAAASGKGATTRSGGKGGDLPAGTLRNGSGGGGAAGPTGNGNAGVNGDGVTGSTGTNGGSGDAGSGGAAGTGAGGTTGATGGAGGNGTEFDASHGSGGGGGGAGGGTTGAYVAGNGGTFGGGGGGAGGVSTTAITSGAGANGLIVIIYTPILRAAPRRNIIMRRS